MKKEEILYVVVPCYNEEEVLTETTKRLKEKLENLIKDKKISNKSRVMYVNDGSKDNTWNLIEEISNKEKLFTGISLSRNRGHQNALLAGLMTAKNYADIVISMDADLQDDINAIDEMIEKYNNGAQIVYGVRSSRKKDTAFKRITAEGFYKFMKLMGVEVVFNHADYRLISSRVLQEFAKFEEVNLFLRGLVPLVGFNSTCVYYERHERMAGESHYPLSKMLALAFDGITSLSIKPLTMITSLGLIVSLISFIGVIWTIIAHASGGTVTGWASTTCIICFLGGIQLISIGVLGEYIGKIYLEVKHRPRYIISERTEK